MRIAILDDDQNAPVATADWQRVAAPSEISVADEHLTGDDLLPFLRGAEVIVAMRERTPIDARSLAALPGLKLLVTAGMRSPSIRLAAGWDRGIVVCGRSGSGPAAELAFGLTLALARQIPAEVARFRNGDPAWQATLGTELRGKTLGFGRLGAGMARYAAGFAMDVVAHLRSLTAEMIGLPHLGYVTEETYRAFYEGAVEDIEAWRNGTPLRVLNP